MKIAKVICSVVVAIAVGFGCWFGVDYFGSKSNAIPVVNPETVTDIAVTLETPTNQAETPTNAESSFASSMVSSETSSTASKTSSVVSKKPASSKPVSSKVTSSKTSSPQKPTSSVVSSTVKKPVVTVKKDKNETDIVTYTKRPSYASIQKEIKALAKEYPELISYTSAGKSVQGRNLTYMKVGKGKTKALIIAGIHARESITVSYIMRCVEEFCEAYESKSKKYAKIFDMENLLENYTLYIMPLANPDGLEIISGRDKPEVTVTYRGDMDISDYKGNANGVNLNKNFPLLWNKINNKVTKPDAEGYKGPSAGSEPETKALMKLCNSNDFAWMTSIHVRGDCVYWSDSANPSVGSSEKIVDILKDKCGFYKCNTSTDINGYGGGFENWFRDKFNKPGLCLELMPLDETVTPLTNTNHSYFSKTVRWDVTKKVLPYIMVYGFPR